MQTSNDRYIYNQLRFNNGLTWAVSGLFLLLSINFQPFELNFSLFIVGTINLLLSFFHQYVLYQTKKQIRNRITVSFGWIMVFGILFANPFLTISAILYLKQSTASDYIYSIYMIVVDFIVIAVTLLNLFKPFVANTFLIGFFGLLAILFFHIFILLAHDRWYNWSYKIQNSLLIILVLTSLSGNILALFVAVSFYQHRKTAHKRNYRETSIRENLIQNPAALLGLIFITFLIMIAITSYLTFSYTFAIQNNYSAILQPPSLLYPFGTDNVGRDVFSRIIFGSRISLTVGLITTVSPFVIGGFLGAISGYYGGKTDNLIMRALDMLYAIPGILLAITIIAAFGTSLTNLIIALSIGSIPAYARTMRANVLQVSNYDYIEASQALGQDNSLIIWEHIIPNAIAPMIIRATLTVGTAVISTSSLSFLGLGVDSHVPEWGNILRMGSEYLETHPHLAIYPGLAIILLVLSFNFLGDGIRDATDPRLES